MPESTPERPSSPVGPVAPGVRPPGVCFPWDQKAAELPPLTGDEKLTRRVWQDVDGLAYVYIWHCLLSF